MKRMIWSAIIAGFAAGFLVIEAQAQADKCISGYVWREAFPGDHVCVTPETRAQAAYDNYHASERIDPESLAGALYGGETCLAPYVPRLAGPSDLVCVTTEIREQTIRDNEQAKYRLAYAYADDRTWKKPRWFDYRLDWCFDWGTDCGQPAADYYCNRKEYRGARYFEPDPNIGASEPTMVIRGQRICDQNLCTGFKYITCYGRISEDWTYENPEWKGKRLDWCVTWDKGCGRLAANAFCRAKGFSKSFAYFPDAEPSEFNTISIGKGEVWDVNVYKRYGFQVIICQ